jgi:hypothetical protein
VRGDVDFVLECTAPDDGTGVTEWTSTVAQSPVVSGNCYTPADGFLALTVGSDDSSTVQLYVYGFTGGGSYHLGTKDGGEQLNVHAKGGRTDPAGVTDADTYEMCSPGCDLDVLPHGREPVPNDWVTYRFIVTCDSPLGTDDAGCGLCTMVPNSFQIEAACFFPTQM